MSRNGSGTYTLPAGNPVVTGTTITTTWANSTLTDIASALTGSVAADGQTPMSGNLNMGSNKIIAVTDPTSAQDAATKAYVDLTQTAAGITGGTITGAVLTNDTIDSSHIGNTTRSTVKATTLDLGLSTQSVAIGQGNASIMKNRIINGAMVIDQRNAGASGSAQNAFVVDRWNYTGSQASKFTYQQNAGSVTPPTGFTNYLGVTSSSAYSVISTDYFNIGQSIEGFNYADLMWGTANAKTVTLSAWVYSSLTGTFGGALRNGAANYSYPFTYSIPVANTWTQISITIAGPTAGTWVGATNGAGVFISFGLGVGSTYSGTAGSWSANNYLSATGATSVVGTSGATFYITGVQLEVGSSATGFEYRQYGQELALCQRYYTEVARGTLGANIGIGYWYSSTQLNGQITFPVTMRTAPSLNSTSGTNYYGIDYNNGSYGSITGWTIYRPTIYSAMIYSTGLSGTSGYSGELFNNNSASMIAFSAEL
jgi:hypothetical protein